MNRLGTDDPAERPGAQGLRLSLLGRFAVSANGVPWTFTAPPKTLPLLAYLLLHRDAVVRRDHLSFLLWPDLDEVEAKTNLRRHLHYLQRGLPSCGSVPWIKADPQRVSWNADAPFSLDVSEFVELSSSGDTQEQAVALYRGDLLEEIFADDWLIPERERLRNLQFANLRALIVGYRIERNHRRALQYAEQTLAMDPWREDAIRHLMSLRDEIGDRAGALAEFERFSVRLRDDLGVDPMPETIALHETIRDQSAVFALPHDDVQVEREMPAAAAAPALAFVGRAVEIEALRAAWVRATRGHGTAMLIGGEAGIGKTRLAAALAETAGDEGGRVLWGQTGSVEASPYQAMLDALRSGLRLLENAQLDDLWLSAVAGLVPELRARRPALPPLPNIAPEREQTRVFETFGRAFDAIARSRPLLLVLEDLHWAGSSTIALFEHLLRRVYERPILILGTFREEELAGDHPLRAFRRRVSRERIVKTLPLGPLALPDLEQLLAAVPGFSGASASGLAATLFTQSGGNPFFFGELLRGRDERAGESDAPHAKTIETAIAARLERLSTPARTVAQFAAIIGSGFDLEVLVASSGWSEADVMTGVHELIDRHIVRDAGFSADDYAFSHQLIQSAIYGTVSADEARRRHHRVAVVMQQFAGDRIDDLAGQLALHFDRGGDAERASALYLGAAKRALAIFANDEASRYATRGLELSVLPAQRLQLLLTREEAHRRLPDRDAQLRDLDEAQTLLGRNPDAQLSGIVARRRIALARARGERADEEAGVRALRTLAAESQEPRLMADALMADAAYHVVNGDLASATSMLLQALDIFETMSDTRGQIEAYVGLLNCSFHQNNTAETALLLAAATELAGQTDDAQLRLVMADYACKVSLMTFDFPALQASAEEMLRLGLHIGDEEGVATAHMRLGMFHVRSFHVAPAREHLALVLKFIESHSDSRGPCNVALYCNALLYLGFLNCELGRFDEGFAFFTRGEEQQRLRGSVLGRFNFLNSRAYYKILCGRSEEARDDIRAALALLEEAPLVSRSVAHTNIGTAHRELGELEEAIANLERGVQTIRENSPDDLFNLAGDLSELSLTYLCAGRVGSAKDAAEEFLTRMDGRTKGFAFPQRMLFIAARVYRAAGEALRATVLLEAAYAEVQRRLEEIPDPATRTIFLEATANREIVQGRADPSWSTHPADLRRADVG